MSDDLQPEQALMGLRRRQDEQKAEFEAAVTASRERMMSRFAKEENDLRFEFARRAYAAQIAKRWEG